MPALPQKRRGEKGNPVPEALVWLPYTKLGKTALDIHKPTTCVLLSGFPPPQVWIVKVYPKQTHHMGVLTLK
jgi:hypothetical protein